MTAPNEKNRVPGNNGKRKLGRIRGISRQSEKGQNQRDHGRFGPMNACKLGRVSDSIVFGRESRPVRNALRGRPDGRTDRTKTTASRYQNRVHSIYSGLHPAVEDAKTHLARMWLSIFEHRINKSYTPMQLATYFAFIKCITLNHNVWGQGRKKFFKIICWWQPFPRRISFILIFHLQTSSGLIVPKVFLSQHLYRRYFNRPRLITTHIINWDRSQCTPHNAQPVVTPLQLVSLVGLFDIIFCVQHWYRYAQSLLLFSLYIFSKIVFLLQLRWPDQEKFNVIFGRVRLTEKRIVWSPAGFFMSFIVVMHSTIGRNVKSAVQLTKQHSLSDRTNCYWNTAVPGEMIRDGSFKSAPSPSRCLWILDPVLKPSKIVRSPANEPRFSICRTRNLSENGSSGTQRNKNATHMVRGA